MEVKCKPICPFRAFYCVKKALIIRPGSGGLQAWCAWTNDECIGYKCQYAVCTRRALAPDGICMLFSRRQRKRHKVKSIEEEAEMLETEYARIKNKLKKLSFELEKLE